MSIAPLAVEIPPLVLHLSPTLKHMSDREFYEFCQLNQDWRIERTAEGDLIILPPAGGETGRRNFTLIGVFNAWVEQDGTGIGFDSSTGFTLPSGAKRSPDLAWIKQTRWEALSPAEREGFPPLCPDFVVELRSRTDALAPLQEKMQEYLANGALLGWLIDPIEQKVHIYRPSEDIQILQSPDTITGDPILPGFRLSLGRLWE